LRPARPTSRLHRGRLYVSCAGIGKDLHAIVSINNGLPPMHRIRNGADRTWTAASPIPSQSGPVGTSMVAATSVNSLLHVFAASQNSLYHTVRYEDGSWWPDWKLLRTFTHPIDRVATTRVGTTVDTAVVTNGEIIHAIRAASGVWSNWGDVEGPAGEIGEIIDVTLAGTGSNLQIIARTRWDNVLYRAVRRADATWQRFARMTHFDGYQADSISAVNAGGDMHFAFVEYRGIDAYISCAVRSAGSWGPIRTAPSTGLTANPGELALAVTAA
jgi:hypothetical protein